MAIPAVRQTGMPTTLGQGILEFLCGALVDGRRWRVTGGVDRRLLGDAEACIVAFHPAPEHARSREQFLGQKGRLD